MAVLKWDEVGERIYQTGIDKGVLYLQDGKVVVWNGLIGIEESPNSELKSFFLDGVKYLEKKSFLKHISDCLSQLIPMNGTFESEPMFSKDRINKTLTFGYFKIIGTLCKYKEGVR